MYIKTTTKQTHKQTKKQYLAPCKLKRRSFKTRNKKLQHVLCKSYVNIQGQLRYAFMKLKLRTCIIKLYPFFFIKVRSKKTVSSPEDRGLL